MPCFITHPCVWSQTRVDPATGTIYAVAWQKLNAVIFPSPNGELRIGGAWAVHMDRIPTAWVQRSRKNLVSEKENKDS